MLCGYFFCLLFSKNIFVYNVAYYIGIILYIFDSLNSSFFSSICVKVYMKDEKIVEMLSESIYSENYRACRILIALFECIEPVDVVCVRLNIWILRLRCWRRWKAKWRDATQNQACTCRHFKLQRRMNQTRKYSKHAKFGSDRHLIHTISVSSLIAIQN